MKIVWSRAWAVVPLVLVATAGCTEDRGCEPTSTETSHDDATIVVEGDPWSGYALFRQELGSEDLLTDTGYRLEYITQLCQDARAADLSARRADVILTSLDQYLIHQPDGTIVGVIDQSNGADALVLNTTAFGLDYLDTIEDLPMLVEEFAAEGRKPVLAYTGNSPSEMLLDELSNTYEELRLDDFDLVSVEQSADAYQMLTNEDAQLAILWEPDVSKAVEQGMTKALSSADVPDSLVDVMVVSDLQLGQDPEAVRTLVRAFYERMDAYLADPDHTDLVALVADDGDLSDAQATNVVDNITLYGSAGANAFMNEPEFPLDRTRLQQSIDSIGSLLALVHPGVDPDEAKVDGRFVAELGVTA